MPRKSKLFIPIAVQKKGREYLDRYFKINESEFSNCCFICRQSLRVMTQQTGLTHTKALSTLTRLVQIHHFRPLSPFVPKELHCLLCENQRFKFENICSNVGLPPSLPQKTTIKKDSIYQKKV